MYKSARVLDLQIASYAYPERSRRGFTLVELLVVISIIAILSVIGITVFSSAQKTARDARRRADLKAIALALEQYKTINTTYPKSSVWLYSTSSQPWITGLDSNYMNQVAIDPINSAGNPWGNGSAYNYAYWSNPDPIWSGSTGADYFVLVAHLENPNSEDLKTKCYFPSGNSNGSTNSGAGNTYVNTFWVCSQQ